MKLLAFDPGKTTGWALFVDNKLTSVGEVGFLDIANFIFNMEADMVIVENYRVFSPKIKKGYTNMWSTPVSVEILGMIKMICAQKKIPIKIQEPSIKPIGYGFINKEYVKDKKGMHIFDAIAHGAFYLVKEMGVSPKCLKLMPS